MVFQEQDFLSTLPLTVCVSADEEEEEDLSSLHPGALLYRSAALQHFPVMADALAHGADVNWVNVAEESKTPLIQAAIVVSAYTWEQVFTRMCVSVYVYLCSFWCQHYEQSRKIIMWAVQVWCNRK